MSELEIIAKLEQAHGLIDVTVTDLNIPVNDVLEISSAQGHFALKLYNVKSRHYETVMWEMELLQHLNAHGVPLAAPIAGANGWLEHFRYQGTDRVGALFQWAPGAKPQPSRETYLLLGEAAARIHAAGDSFISTRPRESYDLATLIDDQLSRMEPMLKQVGEWQRLLDLCNRLRARLEATPLDFGVCHMDLTLDNVHGDGDHITLFDFDSAATGFRANEASGVLRFSESYFRDWLEGYLSIRDFPEHEARTVYVFAIVGEIRGIAWKLGLANSSRGEPLMTPADLPVVVDTWLEWERLHP